MKITDLPKILSFAKELIDVFTDYSFSLDKYFKDENNKKLHKDLYDEYVIFDKNLRDLKGKYKL